MLYTAVRTSEGTTPKDSLWARNPLPMFPDALQPPFAAIHGRGPFYFGVVDTIRVPHVPAGEYVVSLRWDAEPELGEMGLAHLRRKVQRGHFSASSNDRALLSPADLRSLPAADRQDVPLRILDLAAHWLLSNRALFHSLSPSIRHATRQPPLRAACLRTPGPS